MASGSASDLCFLSARQLIGMIRSRDASSREIMQAFCARIDALNPRFNALVSLVDREALLRQADRCDEAVARGDILGPLHGLPQAIKDTVPARGIRSTFGSPLFRDNVPEIDAIVTERIRAAGAVLVGKSNVPEFGLGSHTYNTVFGATGNAWDPTRSAGGSSGGAAVAIALRMLPMAHGSDMGGSLRNPAAWNNVLGFRPSQGRVPHWPREEAFMGQLVTDGPMARSASDLALLLSVQAGPDLRAPLSLEAGVPDWHDRLERDFRGARIGWLGDLGGHLAFEDGILDLCHAALSGLSGAGISLEPLTLDMDWEALWNCFVVLRQIGLGSGRLAIAYEDPDLRRQMKPELQWEIEQHKALSVAQLQSALLTRTAWYDRIVTLFREYDFLALPSAQTFPFPVDWSWPREIAGRPMDSYHRWMEVVVPATLSGCPVVSLPAGFGPASSDAAGLPIGVQLIGRPRDDLSVLQLTHLYEQVAPWMREMPPAAQRAS